MGLFGFGKNKKEELLPDLPESREELPKLPDFNAPPSETIPDLKVSTVPPISPYNKSQFTNQTELPIREFQKSFTTPRTIEVYPDKSFKETRSEPVYIRIDKFQTTTQSFNEIKQKIIEIEKLLAKTKEIKEREEKELEEWEHEIQIIKSRIEAIDGILFKKL